MRPEVLDHVCLIEDHVVPRLALEYVRITAGEGIRGDADVEVGLIVPALSEFLPTLGGTVIGEDLEARKKLLELHFPVQENAGGHDNEVRSPYTAVAGQVSEKGDGLNRLPIGKKDVCSVKDLIQM